MRDIRSFGKKSQAIHLVLLLSIFFVTSGCVHFVSYYDAVSYKNLTDLKGEMKVFFGKSAKVAVHGESDFNILQSFKINISKAYEYEKGKKLNDNTIAQLKILDDMVSEILERFMKRKWDSNNCNDKASESPATGCLTPFYCKAKWKVMEKVFDIAIETERSKLKENK